MCKKKTDPLIQYFPVRASKKALAGKIFPALKTQLGKESCRFLKTFDDSSHAWECTRVQYRGKRQK